MTERLVFQALELERVPLRDRVLIEASAGTGKTWTIAALYLRLLLEKELTVERILVLTFTNKATAELRTRILDRLFEVRAALTEAARAHDEDDALLAHVLGRYRSDESLRQRDRARLTAAIENFDLAPIYTIDAFCQRALGEYAFDGALPFETELIADDSTLYAAAVRDCWRRDMANAHPLWAAWLWEKNVHPDGLAQALAAFRRKPDAHYYLPKAPPERVEPTYVASFEAARAAWMTHADAAFKLLESWKPLNRRSYTKASLPRWRRIVHMMFERPAVTFDLPKEFVRFTRAGFEEKCEGNCPEHALFEAMSDVQSASAALHAAFEARYARWQFALSREAAAALQSLKQERGLQSHDDVLRRLHGVLHAEGGAALAGALRERYAAALIDEFQDTDPLQYAIFERIYANSDAPRYFVGDPKQAIYAFRGADIHAYLDARRHAEHRYTLATNRRSGPALVQATNALFARNGNAFLDNDIEFHAAAACGETENLLLDDGFSEAPLQCWLMADRPTEPLAKGVASNLAIDACADEIARLLSAAREGRAVLRGAESTLPLAGRDIAVLVDKHDQARLFKAALAARGIASVTYGRDSVYRSEEALEVERILIAVAEPARTPLLRAALATTLLGRDANALANLDERNPAWNALVERYSRYGRIARQQGFIRMWRSLLGDETVAERVLGLPEGERRMTNLQHLADLLHCAEQDEGLDLEGLARLLARERSQSAGNAEARQLRLESDEHLVQILTLHTSKGLEFPIVFCPFLWDGGLRADQSKLPLPAFHDEAGRYAFALGAEQDRYRQRARTEEFGEALRLAYVALTRAKHRCVFVWGAINQAQTSALAWLLYGEQTQTIETLEARFPTLDEAAFRLPLEQLSAASGGAFQLCAWPAPPAQTRPPTPVSNEASRSFAARRYTGSMPRPWRVSSFSGLIAPQEREAPDYDALIVAGRYDGAEETAPESAIMALPGGVHTGTMIHQLFEAIDFGAVQTSSVSALVRDKLGEFDFEPRWAPSVERMLSDVVATPLDARGDVRLDRIVPAQRLIEMEFLFPVGDAVVQNLQNALAPLRALGSRLPEAIGSTLLAPARGFIKGYIDLVFELDGRYYIADYKSNRLGPRFEDYAPARLAEAMSESWYDLQYLLYTVAVNRYLSRRLPDYDYERHFGGVYYLFVRGMQPERGAGNGVYFNRPSRALIESLDEALSSAHRWFA